MLILQRTMEEEDCKPAAQPMTNGSSHAAVAATGVVNEQQQQRHHSDAPDGQVSSSMMKMDEEDETTRRHERRRKRRRLKNHMQNQGSNPLFTNFLSSKFDVEENDQVIVIDDDDDNDDDDGDNNDLDQVDDHEEKPLVVIDVDVELGLKDPPPKPPPKQQAADTVSSALAALADSPRINTRAAKRAVTTAVTSSHFSIHTENTNDNPPNGNNSNSNNSPLEEGWYEGVVSPIALPEDEGYLNDVHCFVRQQLEFFSASGDRSSRRKRGRVGMRCKHCHEAAKNVSNFSWPTGSLSYPNTYASVHQACAQRFQVHWQNFCVSMPHAINAQFQALIQEQQQPTKPAKRNRGGIPAPLYYTLSMQRIGLVETPDGLRYSRDLKLEPLPLETVKATMDAQNTLAVTSDYTGMGNMETSGNVLPTPVGSSVSVDAAMKESRGSIDEGSERILAECIAEADQPEKCLARGSDRALVTDYIFVTIRQMALCHALPADLSARGKKTKLLQMGLAGFCCRFCLEAAGGGYVFVPHSCRSFLSAPDNLGSAITNSFTQHLQKCHNVPKRFQKAMAVFKRLHQRQMGLLPYGAQRKFFHLLWDRLREADKTPDEMENLLPQITEVPNTPPVVHFVETANGASTKKDKPTAARTDTVQPVSAISDDLPTERPSNFPESFDEETRKVLQQAESSFADKKVEAAEVLLLPEERILVSDYVFLTLLQLRPTAPTTADSSRTRRVSGGVMGVCCIHCAGSDQVVAPSGRSFPSAPDNFASALNTSLYNHMQACYFIPADVKRALVNLRKLHSAQCQSLRFGSQRKYFNLLFARLRKMYSGLDPSGLSPVPVESKDTLESLGFTKISNAVGQSTTMCKHCRMVPAAFRARDAVCYDRFSLNRARVHNSICQGNGIDLSLTVTSFKGLATGLGQISADLLKSTAFQNLVLAAVGGNNDLKRAFVDDVLTTLENETEPGKVHDGTTNGCDRRRGLWKIIPHEVSFENVNAAFQEMASRMGISSKLQELPALVDYLMIISPSLSIPEANNEDDNGQDHEVLPKPTISLSSIPEANNRDGHGQNHETMGQPNGDVSTRNEVD